MVLPPSFLALYLASLVLLPASLVRLAPAPDRSANFLVGVWLILTNPVLPFFTFQSDFFSHIPATILTVICLYFGVILLFAVIKSLRGG